MDGSELIESCRALTSAELVRAVVAMKRDEDGNIAVLVAHLAVLDERKALDEISAASLFEYCTLKLGYSEAEAYMRIRVARAAAKFPRILTMIGRGEIHVTAVARIAAYLDSDNYRSLLGMASRRTKEEIERLVAQLDPEPETKAVIRAISTGSNQPPAPASEAGLFPATPSTAAPAAGVDPNPPTIPDAPAIASPIAPAGRVLFSFVASEAFRAKFNRAKGVLAAKYPSGKPDEIFDDALEALLERKDPWRRIARRQARRRRSGTDPRSIWDLGPAGDGSNA